MKILLEFITKKPTKAITIAMLSWSGLWLLLVLYGKMTIERACLIALLDVVFLLSAIHLYHFVKTFLKNGVFKTIFVSLIYLIASSIIVLIMWIFGNLPSEQFARTIPLLFIFGIMFWNLSAWKNSKSLFLKHDQEKDDENLWLQKIADKEAKPIDRISVKCHDKINILKMDDIFHLEANGDYVLIFTEKDKYIKEQTMKYFETNLPPHFIRIHRSYIINTDYIIRLEMYGKENYTIRLRNGISLRASNTGYKLLKQYLSI